MKGIFRVFGLLALVSLAACPDSSDDSSSKSSQFDVIADSLMTTAGAFVADREIALKADSAKVAVFVPIEVWLNKDSSGYDDYFTDAGAVKEDADSTESDKDYVVSWDAYDASTPTEKAGVEGTATTGRVLIGPATAAQPSRMTVTFGAAATEAFFGANGDKEFVVVVSIYEPGTAKADTGVGKTDKRLKVWEISFTKADALTLTTALKVGASSATVATGGTIDLTSATATAIDPVAIAVPNSGNADATLATTIATTNLVALKDFLISGVEKVFLTGITGSAAAAGSGSGATAVPAVVTTNVVAGLATAATATAQVAAGDTVRADFVATDGSRGKVVFEVTDIYGQKKSIDVKIKTN